jgi:hypothetical protein
LNGPETLKTTIFGLKTLFYLQSILRTIPTAVKLAALLQEITFDIVSIDEKMLLSACKSVHRKSWAIEVGRVT